MWIRIACTLCGGTARFHLKSSTRRSSPRRRKCQFHLWQSQLKCISLVVQPHIARIRDPTPARPRTRGRRRQSRSRASRSRPIRSTNNSFVPTVCAMLRTRGRTAEACAIWPWYLAACDVGSAIRRDASRRPAPVTNTAVSRTAFWLSSPDGTTAHIVHSHPRSASSRTTCVTRLTETSSNRASCRMSGESAARRWPAPGRRAGRSNCS
jgi:hypothetical protein